MTSQQPKTKRVAKWATGLVAAFLAFAPPGTMIVIALIAMQIFGDYWIIVAAIGAVLLIAAVFLIVRRYRKKEAP